MYVIVKVIENDKYTHFSMLASNGVFEDNNLAKAIIFPTAELATKQKEVLSSLSPDDTFKVKQIVLQDI